MQNFKEVILFDYIENDPIENKHEEFINNKREKIKAGKDD